MAIKVVSGMASKVSLGSGYTHAASAQYGPIPIKNQLVSMRLDNLPVLFRTRTLPSISDGDRISAAGKESNGTLEAVAVRNLTTGAIYYPKDISMIVLSVLLFLLGIPLVPFLGFGFLFIACGIIVLLRVQRVRKAVGLLRV